MKALFIGGTGNISTSVSRLCAQRGIELYLLTRGTRSVAIPGVRTLRADIGNPEEVRRVLQGHTWDVVVDWIAFVEEQIQRDIELFRGRTRQFVFISSASAYQKPLLHPVITESTPLCNPYWDYSRNKIACEERLMHAFRTEGFPITIVRPSHTYDTILPLAIGGGSEYTVIDRILSGRKIIVHGDGSSLWVVTHAEDFAKGFVGLMGHQQAIGQSFHITSDEVLTWNQIHETIAEAVGHPARIVHIPSDFLARMEPSFEGSLIGDKTASVIFDNTKIKRYVPEFVATIPFAVGIRRTLAWFEEDPARRVVLEETHTMIDRIINTYERNFPA